MATKKEPPYLDDQYPEEEDIMINVPRCTWDFNTYDRMISGVDPNDEFEAYQELCSQYNDVSPESDDFEQCHDDYDDDDYYYQIWQECEEYERENF